MTDCVRDLRTLCASLLLRARPPRLSSIPWGSIVRTTRCRSQRTADACRHRETVRAVRTPRHCHHLPGIKTFPSESYAEVRTDSLRTRTASVVLRAARAREPPRPVQHTLGVSCGSVQVGTFNCQTVLPLSRTHRQTMKPFEQQELHGTVTICPELQIANQKVMQK